MKAKVNYNDKEVEIELTEEQIEKINNTKFGDFRDIKTFEDACKATETEWAEPNDLPTDVVAYMKLRIIAKALNGGVDYKAKKPGSRSENKVIKTLKALLSTQEMSEDERAEIEAEITKIQAEEMKAKTPVIDVSLVPEHLRHLVK